jgi:NAD(P)H dehydrogenase (quinone)
MHVSRKFNPVLDRDDFVKLSNPDHFKPGIEQMAAAKTDGFAPDIKAEMEKLEKADLIVIHFPIYWFSVPAIIKYANCSSFAILIDKV